MDRCALFVDAGYVLTDGALAVHGTPRRESVSWDYAGLVQLLGNQAAERTRLPLLRTYWYEANAEGRRSADHDTVADLPGVKLRLAKKWPGRREGTGGEIHRDLTTLARNKAVSDVMLVSADEELAQAIGDVQNMGLRVTLLQIRADGSPAVARALRQECDDVVEVGAAQLRPYVELISGAEPAQADESDPAAAAATPANGTVNGSGYNGDGYHGDGYHGNGYGTAAAPGGYAPPQAAPAEYGAADYSAADYSAAEYAAAEYQGASEAAAAEQAAAAEAVRPEPAETARADFAPAGDYAASVDYSASVDYGMAAAEQPTADHGPALDYGQAPEYPPAAEYGQVPGYQRPDYQVPATVAVPAPAGHPAPREDLYAAPVAVPAAAADELAADRQPAARLGGERSGYAPGSFREQYPREAADLGSRLQPVPVSVPAGPAEIRRLPVRGPEQPAAGQQAPGLPAAPAPGPQAGFGQPGFAQPAPVEAVPGPQPGGQFPGGQLPNGQPANGQFPGGQFPGGQLPNGHVSAGQPTGGQPVVPLAPVVPMDSSGIGYAARGVAPAGPRPVGPGALGPAGPGGNPGQGSQPAPAGPAFGQQAPVAPAFGQQAPAGAAFGGQAPGVSLADAVQSAHEEGQAFGESVARDAPALWLEAVLARKPRMPSDLEARLLQGSALPIDFLLHDEVRHALRRGFWDALERARR